MKDIFLLILQCTLKRMYSSCTEKECLCTFGYLYTVSSKMNDEKGKFLLVTHYENLQIENKNGFILLNQVARAKAMFLQK